MCFHIDVRHIKGMARYLKSLITQNVNDCVYFNVCRTFFRHYATGDDIDELLDIYKEENPNAKN